MRIGQGVYQGRKIDTPPNVKGHSSFTPSLIKKSVFDILQSRIGNEFPKWHFVDLCLGSAQMAIEALSLEFGKVSGCELNQNRIRFLLGVIQKHKYNMRIYKRDFLRSTKIILESNATVFFLDLPFSFWDKNDCLVIDQFMQRLSSDLEPRHQGSLIGIIQGPESWQPDLDKIQYDVADNSDPNQHIEASEWTIQHRRYRGQYLTIVEL